MSFSDQSVFGTQANQTDVNNPDEGGQYVNPFSGVAIGAFGYSGVGSGNGEVTISFGGNTATYTFDGHFDLDTYTVQTTGLYYVTAFGAQGGAGAPPSTSSNLPDAPGGQGAEIGGWVYLTAGDVLDVAVGGAGSYSGPGFDELAMDQNADAGGGGGGGGTFLFDATTNTLLAAAGGGGGGSYSGTGPPDWTSYTGGAGIYNGVGGGADGGGAGAGSAFGGENGGGGGGGFNGAGGNGFAFSAAAAGGGGGFPDVYGGAAGGTGLDDDPGGGAGGFGGGGGGASDGGAGGGGGYSGGAGGTTLGVRGGDELSGAGGGGSSYFDSNVQETVTITLSGGDGSLRDSSGNQLTPTAPGVYTLSGTAYALSLELDGLEFDTPLFGNVPNTSATTTFTLSVLSSGSSTPTVDSTTSVTTIQPPAATTIGGTVANQHTVSGTPVTPFSSVTITDPNNSGIDTNTLTITLSGGGTLADGAGFNGLTTGAAGTYTLSGTAANITQELDALVFTPSAGAPNTITTTTFTLSDLSSVFGTPTTDATTTVINSNSAGAAGGPPTITGTQHAQTTTSETPVTPFAGTTIADPNAAASIAISGVKSGNGEVDIYFGGKETVFAYGDTPLVFGVPIQFFTAPTTGVYDIVAYGAQGGGGQFGGTGGLGAELGANVYLTAGEVLGIEVGGQGEAAQYGTLSLPDDTLGGGGGGGGETDIFLSGGGYQQIAGGGGGGGGNVTDGANGADGSGSSTSSAGGDGGGAGSSDGGAGGAGGVNGGGGGRGASDAGLGSTSGPNESDGGIYSGLVSGDSEGGGGGVSNGGAGGVGGSSVGVNGDPTIDGYGGDGGYGGGGGGGYAIGAGGGGGGGGYSGGGGGGPDGSGGGGGGSIVVGNVLDTLTITLSGGGGTLADGAGFDGLATSAPGIYTLSGAPDAITQELDALVFTPTGGAPGSLSTTTFALDLASSASAVQAMDATTTVTNSDTTAPTLGGSAAYNAANGKLTVTGTNFTTSAGDYSATALTLTGEGGTTYTLTGGSIEANPTSTTFVVDLSAADQLAIDGLLNENGTSSVGSTTYNLAAASSFDTGGTADATSAVTVSNALTPSISSVSFNYATGVLTLGGGGFENEGGTGGLRLGDFTFEGEGGSTYTLSTANAAVTSATAATIALNGSDLTSVKALFNNNGTGSSSGTTYNLAATIGWDSDAGAAITTEGITVSGVPSPPVVVAESMSVVAGGTATGTAGTGGSGALAGDSDPNSAALSVSAVAGGTVGSSAAGIYGHLTLNADGSYSYVADIAAAIAGAATGAHPVDTFDYTVSDTDGQSTAATLAFTIDRPPTLSSAATTVGYGSAAIALSPNLVAVDPDGDNLSGATMVISGGFANDGDTLTATTTDTSITALYNSANETLTLSGGDTAADYTAVLDSVTFKSLDFGANNAGANDTRTVTWTVSDGSDDGSLSNSSPPATTIQIGSPAVDDYTGAGTSDILFRDDTTGRLGFDQMSNGAVSSWQALPQGSNSTYAVVGTGDFNGDATDEILFRDNSTGDTGYYAMVNGVDTGWQRLGTGTSTAYTVDAIGDFTGNGTSDILFRDDATGDMGFYQMSPTLTWHPLGGSSSAYSVVGAGDFFGNGTDDILFRNNATGDMGFDEMSNGSIAAWVPLGGSSTAYSVVGTGDFMGNGTDDILFRDNATGDTGFYEMVDGVNTGWHDIGASSTAYSVVATGDYLGNGTDDILYRDNTTGDAGFYTISNGVNVGWHDIGGSSTAYHVVS